MGDLSTAYTLGLGVEAIVSVAIGTYLFEERLSRVSFLGSAHHCRCHRRPLRLAPRTSLADTSAPDAHPSES